MRGVIRWIIPALAISLITTIPVGCDSNDQSSPAPPASASSAQHFTSQVFSVPFTARVPASLAPRPSEDTKTLISWRAVGGENGVRFLLPVVIYRPDSTTPQPPPSDYPSYMRGLVGAGATFADQSTTTVDGHEAILMTGTTSRALDGTLGCPAATTPVAVCFGLQPDVALRIAVVGLDGRTLLAWARTQAGAPDTAEFFAAFETMLHDLQLR